MTDKCSRNEDAAVELQFEITQIVQEEIGYNEMFANMIAEALTRGLRRRLGGQEVYIPAPDKAARNAAIKREFNGRNLAEMCRKYDLSPSGVYKIVGQKSTSV
jgi:Mor family transcriptional regulator